jgi:hypothetical protein
MAGFHGKWLEGVIEVRIILIPFAFANSAIDW